MCTNPLYRVTDYQKQEVYFYPESKEEEVKEHLKKHPFNFYKVINCGSCTDCKIENSKNWGIRCMNELKYHTNNEMITLTYNEENLPKTKKELINKKTGQVYRMITTEMTLNKKDVQDFMKRLRKKYQNLRFFMCGEYGTKGRPHYHLIIFGLKLKDKEFAEMHKDKSGKEHALFKSKDIEKIWGKGRVRINEVTKESIEYVARYCLKKWKALDNKKEYIKRGKVPEYLAMSNKPGIGYQFAMDNMEKFFKNEKIFVKTKKGIKTQAIPRYYKKLMEREKEEEFEQWKKSKMKLGKLINNSLQMVTGLNADELREIQENKLKELKQKRTF